MKRGRVLDISDFMSDQPARRLISKVFTFFAERLHPGNPSKTWKLCMVKFRKTGKL